MNIEEKMRSAIENAISIGPIIPSELAKHLNGIALQYTKVADELGTQLLRLIGDETALTIPLADGCVAKVKFSKPVTQKTLIAFAKIFQNIADNYVPEAEDGNPHA